MTQEITNKALQWAQAELAAREAEENWESAAQRRHSYEDGVCCPEGCICALPSQSREQAKSILEELTPLFAEQARIRHWNEMRPGKEPRLI